MLYLLQLMQQIEDIVATVVIDNYKNSPYFCKLFRLLL